MVNFQLIVAQYQENIDWLVDLPSCCSGIVYQKGNKEQLPQQIQERSIQWKSLPNVGREGHTYYSYIVEHYHHLPEWMVFVQGNPFDHSPNLLSALEILASLSGTVLPPPFFFLSETIHQCNLEECIHHPGLPLRKVFHQLFSATTFLPRKEKKSFSFGAGGQFAVSSEAVLRHPLDFYQRIVELLQYENNPIEGFVIERFHGLIFSRV